MTQEEYNIWKEQNPEEWSEMYRQTLYKFVKATTKKSQDEVMFTSFDMDKKQQVYTVKRVGDALINKNDCCDDMVRLQKEECDYKVGRRPFTTESCIDSFAKFSGDIDISWIPKIPEISYYDCNDNFICKSNEENIFYGMKYMINKKNLKGYYCTIETEWWDENDEYQGFSGKKNFKKFYFNVNDEHLMSDFPCNIFEFPYYSICQADDTN